MTEIKPYQTQEFLDSLSGLTEEEAINKIAGLGGIPRIIAENGNYFIGTCEFRTDRVNYAIENGRVVKGANIG